MDENAAALEGDVSIDYLHPDEPPLGEPATVAVVNLRGQEYPMIVRGADRGDGVSWNVAFGDLADEGQYPTFAEARRAAHERAPADAAELVRATRDGGY